MHAAKCKLAYSHGGKCCCCIAGERGPQVAAAELNCNFKFVWRANVYLSETEQATYQRLVGGMPSGNDLLLTQLARHVTRADQVAIALDRDDGSRFARLVRQQAAETRAILKLTRELQALRPAEIADSSASRGRSK